MARRPGGRFAILYDYQSDKTWEVVGESGYSQAGPAAVGTGGATDGYGDDRRSPIELCARAPKWQRALLARGIRDFNMWCDQAWTAGYFACRGRSRGGWCGRCVFTTPGYAELFRNPIEGLVAHVKYPRPRHDHHIVEIPNPASQQRPLPLRIGAHNAIGERRIVPRNHRLRPRYQLQPVQLASIQIRDQPPKSCSL